MFGTWPGRLSRNVWFSLAHTPTVRPQKTAMLTSWSSWNTKVGTWSRPSQSGGPFPGHFHWTWLYGHHLDCSDALARTTRFSPRYGVRGRHSMSEELSEWIVKAEEQWTTHAEPSTGSAKVSRGIGRRRIQ